MHRNGNGTFKAGNKGRPIGAENRVTREMRELLDKALQGEVKRIPEYIASITDPEKKLNALAKLLPYILPKYAPAYEPKPDTPEEPPLFRIVVVEDRTEVEIRTELSATLTNDSSNI